MGFRGLRTGYATHYVDLQKVPSLGYVGSGDRGSRFVSGFRVVFPERGSVTGWFRVLGLWVILLEFSGS